MQNMCYLFIQLIYLGTFKESIDFGNGNETEVKFEVIAE